MSGQHISITEPNNQWLRSLVERKAYASKSEVVNALIRHAREQQNATDWLRAKLIRAEERVAAQGYVNKSPDAILNDIKARAQEDGQL